MSHFLTIVLVERTPPRPEMQVRKLLEPYFHPDPDPNSRRYKQWKCDGWVIGGQYDGVIFGKEQYFNLKQTEYENRYGLGVVEPANNIRPVAELSQEFFQSVYALVAPDGVWRDRQDKTG